MLGIMFTLSDPPTAAENAVLDLAAQSLENAVDSGWGRDWFHVSDYQWADKDHNADMLPPGRDHFAIATFREVEEDGTPTGTAKRLRAEDIVQAWVRLANEPDLSGSHAREFLAALQTPDDADFDAIDDDVAAQVAVLGEVRYG